MRVCVSTSGGGRWFWTGAGGFSAANFDGRRSFPFREAVGWRWSGVELETQRGDTSAAEVVDEYEDENVAVDGGSLAVRGGFLPFGRL